MSCDCEIYEICRECAPSPEAFEKACRDRDEALKQVRERDKKETSQCQNQKH